MIQLLSFTFIVLLGAMSPGPDVAIVTRYALAGSRKGAVLAGFGIGSAILIHVLYASLGVAYLLTEFPLVFRCIQLVGSIYLGYLGIQLLLQSKKSRSHIEVLTGRAFMSGFLCNLLNPKATLFIFGLFTQFTNVNTPASLLFLYALIVFLVSISWFSLLAYLITHPLLQERFQRLQGKLMQGMGLLLIALAISVCVNALI